MTRRRHRGPPATPAEIFERHNQPLLELITAARERDWPEVANVAALLHTKLMVRRQGDVSSETLLRAGPGAADQRAVGDAAIPASASRRDRPGEDAELESARVVSDNLEVRLHDRFFEIVSAHHSDGVAVTYDELSELLKVLAAISTDLTGRS